MEGSRDYRRFASENGDKEAVLALLASGANPNSKDGSGKKTSLHHFADRQKSFDRFLRKAEPFADDADYLRTVLDIVSGDAEIVDALLSAGADPDAKDPYGDTLLHLAVEGGRTQFVLVLLAAGADPRVENIAGERPQDVAVMKNHLEIVRILEQANE